jgi:hypothetical protein
MNVQQYHAGETVEATIDFIHGERVENVTVTFAHTDDPDTKLHLSGAPDEEAATEGAGYTYYRVVLSGDVTADDKLGTYRCEAVEAEYPGGLRVPFGGVPDVGIELTEADIPPPEIVSDWVWRSEQQ